MCPLRQLSKLVLLNACTHQEKSRMLPYLDQVLDEIIAPLVTAADGQVLQIDAIEIAQRLGLFVVYDTRLSTRGRNVRLSGQPLIVVRPDERPERVQWAVAHELGESHAAAVARVCGEQETPPHEFRESVANRFAVRLLLPDPWFTELAREEAANLEVLKSAFPAASYELIAWRLLDLPEPAIMTVLDQGKITRRRSNQTQVPPWQAQEQQVWEQVHSTAQPHSDLAPPWHVQGWPVHEPEWKREVIRTTWCEQDF